MKIPFSTLLGTGSNLNRYFPVVEVVVVVIGLAGMTSLPTEKLSTKAKSMVTADSSTSRSYSRVSGVTRDGFLLQSCGEAAQVKSLH